MANISMRPLQINDAIRERAGKLMAFALTHRESLAESRNRQSTGLLLKDAQAYTLTVPVGYNIAYTIEQDVSLGWVQRVSVWNQLNPKTDPSPEAVTRILSELFKIVAQTTGKGGVLNEALRVERRELPSGHLVIDLLYPFKFPEGSSESFHVEQPQQS